MTRPPTTADPPSAGPPCPPSAGPPAAGPPGAAGPPPQPSAVAGAVAGVLTAAVAMGVGQLVAGLTVAQASPVLAVGQAAIDLTPLPVKDFAISTFGTNDKTALVVGILVVLAGFAAVIGILAVRRLALGLAGLGAFASIGLAAALTRPTATAAYVIPNLIGAGAGAFALTRLIRAARRLPSRPAGTAVTRPGGTAVDQAGRDRGDQAAGWRARATRPARVYVHAAAQPGGPRRIAGSGPAAVPDHQRASRGDRGGGHAGRT